MACKAILTADCHLQRRAWAKRPTLQGDAYFSFEQIVDLAVSQQADIIAAGDVIDRRINEQQPIAFLRRQLARLQEAGVHLYHIQGQHEWQEFPWLDSICPEVAKWLPPLGLCEIAGIKVYGVDWTPAAYLPDKLASVPADTQLLVLHQVYAELSPALSAELVSSQLPDVPLLLIGDTHVHHVGEARNAAGNTTTYFSPGSIAMQSIDEDAKKYVFVLSSSGEVETVRLSTRPVLRQSPIRDIAALNKFVSGVGAVLDATAKRAERLPPDLRLPILEVPYDPAVPSARERILRVVGDRAHLFEKDIELAETLEAPPSVERKAVLEAGLLGCLQELCRAREYSDDVLAYARELLENPSSDVVASWRQRFLCSDVKDK